MPELPEVETTRLGIAPLIRNLRIRRAIVRDARLRWPIPADFAASVSGQQVLNVQRRGKYLLIICSNGCILVHLGMSGSLRILPAKSKAAKHDHVDLIFSNNTCLRFNDPRRFGLMLWLTGDPFAHKLLQHLGPEPLSDSFGGEYLYQRARNRKSAVKNFIMDIHIVVGIGNIYANEALFMAEIKPTTAAGRISKQRYQCLTEAIRNVLAKAISSGGTTLRDFTDSEGQPGYFAQELKVYGRKNEPCSNCGNKIRQIVLAQRATYFCNHCQH